MCISARAWIGGVPGDADCWPFPERCRAVYIVSWHSMTRQQEAIVENRRKLRVGPRDRIRQLGHPNAGERGLLDRRVSELPTQFRAIAVSSHRRDAILSSTSPNRKSSPLPPLFLLRNRGQTGGAPDPAAPPDTSSDTSILVWPLRFPPRFGIISEISFGQFCRGVMERFLSTLHFRWPHYSFRFNIIRERSEYRGIVPFLNESCLLPFDYEI